MDLGRCARTRWAHAAALLALAAAVVAGVRVGQDMGLVGRLFRPTYVVAPAGSRTAREMALLKPLHPRVVPAVTALPAGLSGADVVLPSCPSAAGAVAAVRRLYAAGDAIIVHGCSGAELAEVTTRAAPPPDPLLTQTPWQGMQRKPSGTTGHNLAHLADLAHQAQDYLPVYAVAPPGTLTPAEASTLRQWRAHVVAAAGALPPGLARATVVFTYCPHGAGVSALSALVAQGDAVFTRGCSPRALVASSGAGAAAGSVAALPWQGMAAKAEGWTTPAWTDLAAVAADTTLPRPVYTVTQAGGLAPGDLSALRAMGARVLPDVDALPGDASGATLLFTFCPHTAASAAAVTAAYAAGDTVVTYGCGPILLGQLAQEASTSVWRSVRSVRSGWTGAVWGGGGLPAVVRAIQAFNV